MSRSKKLECRIAELVQQFPDELPDGILLLDKKVIHAMNELMMTDELLFIGDMHYDNYWITRAGEVFWDSRWFWIAYKQYHQFIRYRFVVQDEWHNGYVVKSTLTLAETETYTDTGQDADTIPA